ncbi:MAG TPA: DUF167 domain-containing protein [Solimonas sp.]|nr:DUF167 domain-containing protein [Solimonas sp.]
MALLQVKVSPGASRNAVSGWMGDTLKLSVTAAPERGKANEAVIALLAGVLGLPKSRLQVVRGQTQATKQLAVEGLDQAELWRRLGRGAILGGTSAS